MVICFSLDWLFTNAVLSFIVNLNDFFEGHERLAKLFREFILSLSMSIGSSLTNDSRLFVKLDWLVMVFLDWAALYNAFMIIRFKVMPNKLGSHEPNMDVNQGKM